MTAPVPPQGQDPDPLLAALERERLAHEASQRTIDLPAALQRLRRWAGVLPGLPYRVGSEVGQEIAAEPLDVPRQVGRGLAESGYATAIGLSRLAEQAPGRAPLLTEPYRLGAAIGRRLRGAPDEATPALSETLRAGREEAREFYGPPKTPVGEVAGIGARMAGDVAQYMAPGAVLQAAKIAAPASLAGRVGLQVATGAPITAAMAASGPGESLTGTLARVTGSETLGKIAAQPAARVGLDVAIDALLAGSAEAITTLVRRGRAATEAAVRAGRPDIAHAFDAMTTEAHDLAQLPTRTPEQDVRLRTLAEQLHEGPVGAPARPGEALHDVAGQPIAGTEVPAAKEPATVTLPTGQAVREAPESAARADAAASRPGGAPAPIPEAPPTPPGPPTAVAAPPEAVPGQGAPIREAALPSGPPPTGAAPPGGPPPPIDPDRYVNVAKFALDPTGEARLRDEVTRVVQTEGLHPKQVVPWSETRRLAEDIGLRPDDLLRGKAERHSGPEMLAIRNIVKTNIEDIEQLTRVLASGPVQGEEFDRLSRAIAVREDQNAALLGRFVRARTAAGRDLNNLKILAQRTTDPLVWLAKARQIAGEAGFTADVQAKVRRLLNEGKRSELVQWLATLRQAPQGDKAIALWKAGLLTNPKTHIVNVVSNMTMAALETIKDTPAAAADWLFSLHTHQITKGPTTLAGLRASAEGARQGAREAYAMLRGAGVEEAVTKLEIPKEVHFDNAILEAYTQTVFRTLNAEDRVFRGAALQRSLAEQAQVVARQEGLKGEARIARVRALRAAPTDEMAAQAVTDAEVATFRDVTPLARAAAGARDIPFKLGEILLPFRRTPAAVGTRLFEYSPFGLAKGVLIDGPKIWRAASQGAAIPAAQRHAAELIGRGVTGSGVIYLGWLLQQHGLATGAVPSNEREKEQWRLEGRQPNSVLLNGAWRNVGRISPVGNLLALGANIGAAVQADSTQTWLEQASQAGFATVRTVADQPFLVGVQQGLEALHDPATAGARYATTMAGSVIPAGVAAAARTIDPTIRRPRSLTETIESRVPGLTGRVRPVRNVFGQTVERDPGVIANLLDPTTPRRDVRQDDPLVAEMARVGAGITALKKLPAESEDAFTERQIEYGRRTRLRLEQLVRSAGYQRADRDRQAELIEDTVTDLRRGLARRPIRRR